MKFTKQKQKKEFLMLNTSDDLLTN